MRAAPSMMSSGGEKPSSALRAAWTAGSSSVTQPGVDRVHVDAVLHEVGRAGARHHVQRRLRHVGVRVLVGLGGAVELSFHRADVDDVLVRARRAHHERLEARVEDVRRDGVHELHFEQLGRFDLVHAQAPAVHLAQVDLLQILVETVRGEERLAAAVVLVQVATLREGGAVHQPLALVVPGRCQQCAGSLSSIPSSFRHNSS